jgi:hypothetical protein
VSEAGGAPSVDPRSALRPFVEALGIDEDGRLRLAGARIRAAPRQPEAAAQLSADLALCVYEHAYARGFPSPAPASEPDADVTALIQAANTTRARMEDGWTVEQSRPDGSMVAARHGRSRRFAPGRFLTTDGVAPPRAGSPIMVSFPAGSAALQPGFFHCFGEATPDPDDPAPLVRLYWNVRLAQAADFVRDLTAVLNRYEIPFEFKITTRSGDFRRRDNAVLYLTQDLFRVAALAIASALPRVAGGLEPDTPLFTKPLADGIGAAEDPGRTGQSFGSARSQLTASALLAAREDRGFSFERFCAAFEAEVARQELRLEALWLNPGSPDVYELPRAAAMAAA